MSAPQRGRAFLLPRLRAWLRWGLPPPSPVPGASPAGIFAKMKQLSPWFKYPGGPGGTPGLSQARMRAGEAKDVRAHARAI